MSDVYLGAIAVVSVLALAAIVVAAGLDGQPPHRRRRRGPAASRSVAVGTVQAVADSENPLVVVEVESVNGQRFTGRLCHRQGDPAVAALRPGLILLVSLLMLGMVAAMKGFSGRQGTELAELIVDKIQSAVDKIAFR